MANQGGRPIAPARKLVAAVLGTIAVFVMVYGLGLSSWAIVVLGLAMLALSIALGMVNVVRRGARAWVSGTAQVKAISDPPVSAAYGRAELQVVVVAPGLPITEVLIRDPRVPVDKWPPPGETLPVTVDVDDMRRVRIDWPNAPDRADPPPPGASYAEPAYDPAYSDPLDEYDDDLLGEPEPPPWNPGMQWSDDDEPPPPPPPAGSAMPPPPGPATEADPRDGGVVVHDTPAGPVLEGQFVDHDDSPPPLPRRAGPVAADQARDQPSPAPRPRPSPRPRSGASAGATTATVDPETATSAGWSPETDFDGTDPAFAQAAPPPAPTAQPPAPEQRPAPDDDVAPTYAGATPAGSTADRATHTSAAPPAATPTESSGPTAHAGATAAGATAAGAGAGAGAAAGFVAAGATTAATGHHADDEIDLPLDGDPEPAPETTPEARSAVAHGLVTPPPADVPHFVPPQRDKPPAEATGEAVDAQAGEPPADDTRADIGQNGETEASSEAAPATTDDRPDGQPDDQPPVTSGVGTAPDTGPWDDLHGAAYEPDDHTDTVITAYPSARPGPAGAIHGVGLTILVTDLDRSVRFYRDTLGFFEIDRGEGNAVLASGDTRVVLRTVTDLSSAGRLIYLNLEVGDVEAVYRELVAKGVVFEHEPMVVNHGTKLELWSATFHDPDDHNIAITQWRSAAG